MQTIDWLQAFFLGTDLTGLFGVLAIITVSLFAIGKNRATAIFFVIVEGIMTLQYYDLAQVTSFYYWDLVLLVLGIVACIVQSSR